jgi:ketosteroid isomerase-like protein
VDSPRAAVVRELYDRFNRADVDGLVALLDSDARMQDPLHGTTLTGSKAIRDYWEHIFGLTDHSITVADIVEAGDAVLVVAFSQTYDREGDKPLGRGVAAVHRLVFRGDRIVSIEYTGVDDIPEQVQQRLA